MAELTQVLIVFWRKLGRLLDGGVPALRALKVVAEETTHAELRAAVLGIGEAVERGKTISEALALSPQFFPLSVCTLVRAGELSGRMELICAEVAKGFEDGSFAVGESPSAPVAAERAGASTEEAPMIKYVNLLIKQSAQDGASDLHLESGEDGKHRIRYRIDGVLHEIAPLPSHLHPDAVNSIKVMAGMNVAEKRLPQDCRVQMSVEGKPVSLWVSTLPCVWGENVCIRFLWTQAGLLPLSDTGFSADQLGKVRGWLHRPNGLILLTGPTGSGKTTTLYGMLQELNQPAVKILTVEDPVECVIPGISQMRVCPAVGLTFPYCLRAVFRQDPDMIMVGEIRDRETVQMITQAVLTGHLVLSSLHTNDACGAVRRLLDIGLDPFLVNATLTGVCAQRLVRRICPACRQEVAPKATMADLLAAHPGIKLYEGRGCDQCRHTGYKGRIAVHELLELDDELRRLIGRDPETSILKEQAVRSGLVTLREDGLAKVNEGLTTLAEVMRVCAGV